VAREWPNWASTVETVLASFTPAEDRRSLRRISNNSGKSLQKKDE
jgi:hypothetical protein